MDRVRAVRFGVKSLQHLESFAGRTPAEIDDDPMSTVVIGIQGAKVLFSPMETVEKKNTDWGARRPLDEFWVSLKVCVSPLVFLVYPANVIIGCRGYAQWEGSCEIWWWECGYDSPED